MTISGVDIRGTVREIPGYEALWRCPLPWLWTDDLAQTLLASGQIDPELAQRLSKAPVAVWGAEGDSSSEEDDDELPLVA